jgi:hypothetical protein
VTVVDRQYHSTIEEYMGFEQAGKDVSLPFEHKTHASLELWQGTCSPDLVGLQKSMHHSPASTLLDESGGITCGHSVAVGDTVGADSPRTLVSCFQYEVRWFCDESAKSGRFLDHWNARKRWRIKI